MKKRTLTVKELAELLNLAPVTIYRLVGQGKLPAMKIASRWRFDPDEVFKFAHITAQAKIRLADEVFNDEEG